MVAWIKEVSHAELFLCAVTLARIQIGIEMTREQNKEKASSIETWLDQVAAVYNVLPMTGEIFRERARMMHNESDTVYEDAMIAACARVHKLTVVTMKVNKGSTEIHATGVPPTQYLRFAIDASMPRYVRSVA